MSPEPLGHWLSGSPGPPSKSTRSTDFRSGNRPSCVCVPMSLRHGWAAQRVQSDHQPECVPNQPWPGSGRTYSCPPWFHSSKVANPPPWHTGHMLCRAEVCPQDPMRYSTFTRAGEEPPHSRTTHDPSPCLHGVGSCGVRVQLRPHAPFHTTAWDPECSRSKWVPWWFCSFLVFV